MYRNLSVSSLFLGLVLIIACSGDKKEEQVEEKVVSGKSIDGLLVAPYPTDTYDMGLLKLSEYGFFKQPLNQLMPISDRVIPYELNSPLFTDYASKKRFIYLPEGTSIDVVKDDEILDFPVGTVIIKNFYYKGDQLADSENDRIIETRLLVHSEKTKKWETIPYIWNEEQTEAYLYILGKDVEVTFKKTPEAKPVSFTYSTPNVNMCKNCHINNGKVVPIGPSPMQLNGTNEALNNENHLVYMKTKGFLNETRDVAEIEKIPSYQNPSTGNTNQLARAYLQANCAHCHRSEGSAKTSGLYLNYHQENEQAIGINKHPVAAGQGSGNLKFDIVPGNPEESILVYRMANSEPNIAMPEVGKTLIHEEGVALVKKWIEEMGE